MSKKYQVHPVLLGEAQVGCILDVFWSLNTDTSKVKVPIFAFLIEGGPDPIIVDAGMRSAECAHRRPAQRARGGGADRAASPRNRQPRVVL